MPWYAFRNGPKIQRLIFTIVLIVGATSRLGLSIYDELTQGQFSRMFRVFAAVPSNELQEKRERVRSCEGVLEFDPFHLQSTENFINKNDIHAIVLTNTVLLDHTKVGRAWIDIARKANVSYFLMVSTSAADRGKYTLARHFKGLEKYLSSNAPFWTVVRTTPYMDNFLWDAQEIREKRTLTMPLGHAGSFAPIDTKDVARVIAFILMDAAPHHTHFLELTGPSCKNGPGFAKIFSKVLGTEVKYQEIPMEEEKARLKAQGFAEDKIEGVLSCFDAINRHEMMYVLPDYSRITGERQHSMAEFVERNRDAFSIRKEE
jgi:hypothetical protein